MTTLSVVGMLGIEPRLHPPHGRVLPLYYIPHKGKNLARYILSKINKNENSAGTVLMIPERFAFDCRDLSNEQYPALAEDKVVGKKLQQHFSPSPG